MNNATANCLLKGARDQRGTLFDSSSVNVLSVVLSICREHCIHEKINRMFNYDWNLVLIEIEGIGAHNSVEVKTFCPFLEHVLQLHPEGACGFLSVQFITSTIGVAALGDSSLMLGSVIRRAEYSRGGVLFG